LSRPSRCRRGTPIDGVLHDWVEQIDAEQTEGHVVLTVLGFARDVIRRRIGHGGRAEEWGRGRRVDNILA
jgi:hypothetical protein